MDEFILKQIVSLLKEKVNLQIFDIQSVVGWNSSIDEQFNTLIDSQKICCVEKYDINVCPNQYRINTGVDCVRHDFDTVTRNALIDLLNESKNYQSVTGYSEHVKGYVAKMQHVLNSAIEQRVSFMDENQSIMWSILENSMNMLKLDMSLLVGKTIIKFQLPDEDLIDKLLSIQLDLYKKIFA